MAWVISQRRRSEPRFFVSSDPRRGGVERSQNMLSGEWSSLVSDICVARPSLILSPLLVTESGDPSWSRSENHSGLFISTLSSGCHVLSTPSRVPQLKIWMTGASGRLYTVSKGFISQQNLTKSPFFISDGIFSSIALAPCPLYRIHLQRLVKVLMDN